MTCQNGSHTQENQNRHLLSLWIFWHALSHALILEMTTKDRSLVDVGCEWLDGMTQRTSEKTKCDEEREVNFL